MHSNSSIPPAEDTPKTPAGAITALVLAGLGLCGWLTLLGILLPYEENRIILNALTFAVNFFILAAGVAISGVLSLSALLTGVFSLSDRDNRIAYIAVALGAVGLLTGTWLVLWRFHVVFGS